MSYEGRDATGEGRGRPCGVCKRPLDSSFGPGSGSSAPYAWTWTRCYGNAHLGCIRLANTARRAPCPEES